MESLLINLFLPTDTNIFLPMEFWKVDYKFAIIMHHAIN